MESLASDGMIWSLEHAVACVLGLLLSAYALKVELCKARDPNYVAVCDFSDRMSCTKAFMSPYGKGFGIIGPLLGDDHILNFPNPILGIVFYSLQLIIGQWFYANAILIQFLLYSSIMSCIGSIYLGYILYFVLNDFCVVCIATYIVNFTLLYIDYINA
ncbi:vitamin K epoxide reductase complex subunit 1-like protein 1 [Ptychodera flava]|uniref:vitamin K epoxide reductase complex subunit 1-like protein 1 n=1 Tax=Ptychodera flava TaxID=63121 RepID=UPI00396AA72F